MTKEFLARSALVALVLGISAGTASGATGDSANTSSSFSAPIENVTPSNKNSFSFDYGVPTSPALALVSTSSDKSVTSTASKPYTFTLPANWGGAASNDSFAADVAPVWLWGSKINVSDGNSYGSYVNASTGEQVLHRLRLGAAYYPGTNGGSDPTKAMPGRAGFSLSVSLLNGSDPALAHDPNSSAVASSSDLSASDKQHLTAWHDCFYLPDNLKEENAYDNDWEKTQLAASPLDSIAEQIRRAFGSGNAAPAADAQIKNTNELPTIAALLSECSKAGCGQFDTSSASAPFLKGETLNQTNLKQLYGIVTKLSAAAAKKQKNLLQTYAISDMETACANYANDVAAHNPALDFGTGVLWRTNPNSTGNVIPAGEAIWSGWRLPLDLFIPLPQTGSNANKALIHYLYAGGSVRAGWSEYVATGNKTTPEIKADTINAWVGLDYYSSISKFSVQGGYLDVKADNSAQTSFSKSGTRWLFSGSVKLVDIVNGTFFTGTETSNSNSPYWVTFSYGHSLGTVTTLSDKIFTLSLTFSPPDADNIFGQTPSPSSKS